MARTYKAYLLLVALIAVGVGLLLPSPIAAQGGNAVYNSLRVKIPIERRYLEPQGLQDAAYDLLTADMSTMSSTYQTILSASVTVGESVDAVTVHVTGQIGWMGSALYVVDDTDDELWRIDDPTAPGGAVLEGSFPSGLSGPRGITSHGGALYVADGNGELWRIGDPTNPGGATNAGSFPSGLTSPQGITSHGGALYVVNARSLPGLDRLWRIDDPTAPGRGCPGRLIPLRPHGPERHHVSRRGALRGGF